MHLSLCICLSLQQMTSSDLFWEHHRDYKTLVRLVPTSVAFPTKPNVGMVPAEIFTLLAPTMKAVKPR